MSFLMPKPPKLPKPPNPAILASETPQPLEAPESSLITTGPLGLKRKASTQRTSLIGG
jgi:hypothetical protein